MKLNEVDLNDLDTFEQGLPHEQFKLLRNEAPIHLHAGPPGEQDYYCVTKYDDLKSMSKDPAAKLYFMDSNSPSPLPLMNIGDPVVGKR